MQTSSIFNDSPKSKNPGFLRRTSLAVKHSAKVLFLPWPHYSFEDLATVQDAVDGPRFQQMARRMKETNEGRQLLIDRPALSIDTIDWEALSALPTDSFGYCVWHHFYGNQILEEPDLGEKHFDWGDEAEYTKDRFRQTHDFRHVLLGLGISGSDEVLVNVHQANQHPLILSRLIAVGGAIKHGFTHARRMILSIIRTRRSARKSAFLPALRYEDYWHWSIHDLREHLNLVPVGRHYPPRYRHPDAPVDRAVA